MFIADAHSDTLYAMAIRGVRADDLMVTPARLRDGGVGLQTFALFAGVHSDSGTPRTRMARMLSAASALGVAMIQGRLPDAPPMSPSGILSIEGGEVLEGRLENLTQAHALGVKMIALTWNYENEIGHPSNGGSKKGLKPFGRELIAEMDRLGVLCDVSHLNDAGIDEVLALSKLPIVASHSNARAVCDVPRNLARAQVDGIVASRGFIGLNFYSKFLSGGQDATPHDLYRHIEYFLDAGAQDCLGFGSDFDGIDAWPDGLGSPSAFKQVLGALKARGMADALVQGIAGMNLWRVLKAAER